MSQPPPSSLPPIQPGPPLHPQVPAYIPAEPVRKANVWAIVSLVAGLLGCAVPFVAGAVAVVTGLLGVRRSRDERYTGRGLAVAGIVLGVLSLVAWSLGGVRLGYSVWDFVRGRTTQEPLRVASDFLDDLSTGDVNGAARHAGPLVGAGRVQEWSEAAQQWGTFKELTAFDQTVETHAGVSMAVFEGTAEFAAEARAVEISLVKDGEDWKVTDIRFP